MNAHQLLTEIHTYLNEVHAHHAKSNTKKRKVVFRHGKKKIILQCPKGQKSHKGKCVRESPQEKRHRSLGSRKASRKRRSHLRQSNRARKLSLMRRHKAGF